MGTTPNLGLPYPEPGDSPDVPRDMKALAQRIALAVPTIWATAGVTDAAGTLVITFPAGLFTATPKVFANAVGSVNVGDPGMSVHVDNQPGTTDKDKVTVHVRGAYKAGIWVNVLAVGT